MTSEPQQLGPYRLEAQVARGGMGEIWRARDTRDGTVVAVKRIRYEGARSLPLTLRQRLLREVRAFEALAHDNIVRCLDAGIDHDEQPYLVLEWLDGEDLARRRRRAPLSVDEIVEVARQTLRGLAACHEAGLVHRDIKPANLFLLRDAGVRVKVLDFGLARRLDDESAHLTTTGAIVGTLHYLAPEQAHGQRDIDGRADIYALGVVLYELCSGQLPFSGEGPAALLLRIVTERPPRLRALRRDLPAWLDQLVMRAMAREREARFASANEMLDALELGARTSTATHHDESDAANTEADPAQSSSSVETRLVWLLCARATDARDSALAELARQQIIEAGGTCVELLGSQTVGLFGAESSAGDEARRAVGAGLRLREHASQRAQLLVAGLHISIGDDTRFDAQALERSIGDMRSLPAGQLCCDRATRELLGSQLEIARLSGRDVVQALHTRNRRELLGVETPLVGRETELASLNAAVDRAMEYGEPELVLVEGAAGIGKSRLCQELASATSERLRVLLEGGAEALQAHAPYATLRRLLGRACGSDAATTAEHKRAALDAFLASCCTRTISDISLLFLHELLGVTDARAEHDAALQVARQAREVMRERTLSALAELLEAAGEQSPLLLLVDDLQWADMESVHLLAALPARLPRTPLLVLLAARPSLGDEARETLRAAEPTTIGLAPLSRRALRRLLRAARVDPSPELDALVADWSDGSPYFAEELLAWLASRAALVRHGESWRLDITPTELELPTSVEAAVQARLDQLDRRDKELLRSVAVFGEVFWTAACHALGFEQADEQLRALEARQLVVRRPRSRFAGSGEWTYRHAFVHQVAAGMNPAPQRLLLHAAAGSWLEAAGESDPVVLAHHFERGGDGARAAHYREAAGERALRGGDLDQAVEHFLASLSLASERLSSVEQTRRTMGLARACILLGDYGQASMALDHAQPHDRAGEGELLFLRGRIRFGRGDYAGAEETLEGALAALAGSDTSFLARHTLFSVIWAQGRYDDAARVAREMVAQANASKREDQLCSAKLAESYAHTVSGDLSASVSLSAEAAEHARAIGHLYREVDCLVLLASLQELVGLYDEAQAALEHAAKLAERLKTTYHQATVEAGRARLMMLCGQQSEAITRYRHGTALAERIDSHRTLVGTLSGEARALALPGEARDLARAGAAADRAAELAGSHAPPSLAEARLAQAEVRLAEHDITRALDHASAAVELLDQIGGQERYEIEILLVARQALALAGDAEAAAALLSRAGACVQRRAKKISDTQLRRSFVERVPHNARVMALLRESAAAAC